MSKIRDNCDHVVVKAVSNICVGTMPHCGSHSKSCESSLLSLNLVLATSPVRVVTDSCGGVIIGNIGSIVAWFIDDHLVITEVFKGVFLVVPDVASGIKGIRSASSPCVGSIHIVMLSSVAIKVVNHACPSIFLRLGKEVIIEFS